MKKLKLLALQSSAEQVLSRAQLKNVIGGDGGSGGSGGNCGNNYECTVDCDCGGFYVCCTVECSSTSNSITCGSVTDTCEDFCAAA